MRWKVNPMLRAPFMIEEGIDGADGAPGKDGSDASVTKQNVEAVLTGEISSHTHAGGGGGLSQPQVMARSAGC